MPLKAYLAAVLGLSVVAVPVPLSAQPQQAGAIRLAQAEPKANAEEEDDKDDRRRPRRERGQKDGESATGAERDAPQKGKAAGKDAPAPRQETKRAPAPNPPEPPSAQQQQQQRQQIQQPQQSRNRGDDDDSRRDSARDRDDDRRDSARDRDAKERDSARDRGRDDDDRRDSARDRDDNRKDFSRGRDDDDRRDSARSRDRGDDDRRKSFDRSRERDREKTPAQELSRTEVRGDRPVTIDGGNRVLIRENDRVIVRGNDFDRLRHGRDGRANQRVERLPNGNTRTVVVYPDGSQIITVTDRRGEIVHRSRRGRDGREIVLVREVRRPPVAQLQLGPLRLSIPREQYIVDSRRASPRDLRAALIAPPVEPVERIYSLEEVRRFDRLRDKMRRIDITAITFDTDSAVITPDQAQALGELADIINDLIDRNPGELFLIEGHTDLVGSLVYNLALSDRRAESVAIALTEYFGVPPENLVTQGYGESYPKIPTEAAERENRRVAVRRITPLVAGR